MVNRAAGTPGDAQCRGLRGDQADGLGRVTAEAVQQHRAACALDADGRRAGPGGHNALPCSARTGAHGHLAPRQDALWGPAQGRWPVPGAVARLGGRRQ